ncbi:MAG: AccI family restriction endonuclease [Anaerolineae bacterium]|nr:AccI family restriction endonuclease [Anaerolineae bacterium]
MVDLIALACVSIECENSLWVAAMMPDFGRELDPKRLAKGNPGLPKSVVLPTIIIKEEDIGRLLDWQTQNSKPIHVWHTFYDRSYGISLEYANELISTGAIVGTRQTFQAPGGATSHKTIYKIYYHYGYPLAISNEEPQLEAAHIIDKNGHILPYVKFVGGTVTLHSDAITQLNELETARRRE